MNGEFDEGYEAGLAGLTRAACPYNGQLETQERADWLEGWEAATNDEEEDAP